MTNASSPYFEVIDVLPCADSPALVQVHGRFPDVHAPEILVNALKADEWRTIIVARTGVVVGRKGTQYFIFKNDGRWTFSHAATREDAFDQIGEVAIRLWLRDKSVSDQPANIASNRDRRGS
jgi:hypothetical protein